jgi:hypothetical protein
MSLAFAVSKLSSWTERWPIDRAESAPPEVGGDQIYHLFGHSCRILPTLLYELGAHFSNAGSIRVEVTEQMCDGIDLLACR